jgi:hypothetical protein
MFASIAREVNNSRAVTIFFLTAGHHQANELGIAPSECLTQTIGGLPCFSCYK